MRRLSCRLWYLSGRSDWCISGLWDWYRSRLSVLVSFGDFGFVLLEAFGLIPIGAVGFISFGDVGFVPSEAAGLVPIAAVGLVLHDCRLYIISGL